MNILCNLSPLATRNKTGIARVVEHLIQGLAALSEHQIYFHSLADTTFERRYFDSRLPYANCHFARSAWRSFLACHLIPLEDFVVNSAADRSLTARATRKVFVTYFSAWETFLSKVPASLLKRLDIYHSPYRPIPAQIRSTPSIIRFTTIYDLMPVTHPQFFENAVDTMIGKIVNGLTQEDYVFCISQATRATLLQHSKCDPEKVFVTHLAAARHFYADTNIERAAKTMKKYKIPEGRYFLTLSTLEIRKNLETVIRTYGRLRKSGVIGAEVSLVMAGGMGWMTERIDSALEEVKEYRSSIIITGFVVDEDLASLYSNAVGFVYMSRLEGFGLPPLEAMACGTPVITSNTSSLPEVVGAAGILLDPDDMEGLGQAMLSLVENSELRAHYARLALEQAKKFSWERFIKETISAYQWAMAKKGRILN